MESRAKTTELVVLIDNSRSIRSAEQKAIIREATMLLADLADAGDRMSVITFGENAQEVVASTLRSDADRQTFKNAIQQRVDFRERLSDIRAGLRLLADDRDTFFPTPDAVHAAVIFSDGRLEPRGISPSDALQEIEELLVGPLEEVDVYAVVLGDTISRRPIPQLEPPLTGYELMQTTARSPENFYHAQQLDQLSELVVTILNKTKGISSIGEVGGTDFRIDQTVRSMILMVRKRSPNAPESKLPTSEQIELLPPEGEVPGSESIYRNSGYQHFDLFIIRNPRPGIWRVTRTDGGELIVRSKIDSPIHLGVQMKRSEFYLNEAALIRAWLTNSDEGVLVTDDYQLQAQVAQEGELSSSQYYAPLQRDGQTGQYLFPIPISLAEALGKEPQPGRLELEIVAQRQEDPWFLRRSQPMTIELKEPIIRWTRLEPTTRPIPTRSVQASFGGELVEEQYNQTEFDTPPELTVVVERFDDETGQYRTYFEANTRPVSADGKRVYQIPKTFDEYGNYRYRYRLNGSTGSGPLAIESAWYPLNIDFFWEIAVAAGLLLLIVLQMLSSFTAKLRGSIQRTIMAPSAFETFSPGSQSFDSIVDTEIDSVTYRYRIRAKRYLFLVKYLNIKMVRGNATLDGRPLHNNKARSVSPSRGHTLTSDDGNVTVELNLRVS